MHVVVHKPCDHCVESTIAMLVLAGALFLNTIARRSEPPVRIDAAVVQCAVIERVYDSCTDSDRP